MSGSSLQATKASVADFSTFKVAGALEKPCLGQPFQLGMLYDCRSDALIPGVTLWGSEALNTALSKKPFETSDFEIIAEDSLSEKFLRLGVDASLKLSILSGLVQVDGAAKFLYDQKSSKTQARVSLKYKSTTRFEQLMMDQLGNFEYTDVFEKDIATHVVTGMVYGADAFFVFDQEIGENEDMKKIHGNLKVKVGGLPGLKKLAIGGEGSVDINTGDKEDEERLHCKFYGDLILPKHPATFHDAAKVYHELPELLQGKSVPKKVWLYPLGKLDSKAQRMVHQISSRLVDELHMLMESLHDIIMRGNDLIKTEVCSNFFGLKDDLESMKGLISGYRADLKKNLATLLPKVHGGGTDETKVAEILKRNSLSPFSCQTLSAWISGKENEVKVLAGYLKHLKEEEVIQLAFEPGAVDVIINNLDIEAVVCFDFGITWGQDALLLKMEDYLRNGEVRQGGSTPQPWYRNQALMREMRQQFRCFKSFAIANHRREAIKFIVTNSDSKNDTETAFVSLYENGCESKFEAPDKPGQPLASKKSYTGLQLNWEMPKYSASVLSYTVSYTDDESSGQWHTQKTLGAEQQLSGLVPGTAYFFKVRAETNAGCSPDSDVCMTRLPPETHTRSFSAPGKPVATFVTHNSIMVEWKKPKCGANTIKQYQLMYHCIDDDPQNWFTQKTSGPEEKAELVKYVNSNSIYVFKVRAERGSRSSPYSEVSDPIKTKLNPPPGKPSASNITYNGFQLNWNKPPYDIQHYIISYQFTDDPSDKWHTLQTDGSKENTHFSAAEEKLYVFKVAAVTTAGITSDSELSDPIETVTVPWGVKVFKDLAPLPHTNPPTCLLPTHCVMKREGVYKVHVGILDKPTSAKTKSGVTTKCSCHNLSRAGVQHKVLMVVGATKAGKTTLINGMANYILGVQWDDDFRFKLINEPDSQDQTVSQTSCITAYTFYKEKGSPIPYTLTVIDTPGFGDTGGINRDKKIVEQIKELFSIAGDEGIDQLHGIGFVTQAPLARLTPTQRYVFDTILSVFGRDVAGNIFLMTTFADGKKPPVVNAVQAANLPYKAFFKFNNSALFASKLEDDEFDTMFWKMGTNSFKEFFKQFSTAKTQSLQQTREVIQERKKLETIIQGLQPQIKAGLTKVDVVRQERQILRDHEADILSNKDFTYNVPGLAKSQTVCLEGIYVTTCQHCLYTCDPNCVYAQNCDKYQCSAMNEGRGTDAAKCGVCIGKCSWRKHKNTKYQFEFYEETETKTTDDLKKKYESAMNSKDKLEKVINNMKKELDALNTAVLRKIYQACRCIERLRQIALKPDPLTEVEYIDLLIESEKREAKPHWLERVQALEGVREHSKIVAEVMKNPKGQQHNFFSVEESPQEQIMWKKIMGTFGF